MVEVEDNGLVKFSFYLFGIGGLLAWNTILSILDFFIHFQAKYQPAFIYTNLNFVLNVLLQFILVFSKKKFSYKSQILFSLVISVLSMVALPISVIFLTDLTSFITTCIIILLQGFANAIALSCFYSLISFLPFAYIIAFSTGQGIAGIMMNLLRYIIVASLGDPNEESNIVTGSLIFFSISALILVVCIVFVYILYKNPYFISKMRTSGEYSDSQYMDLLVDESRDHIVNSDKLSDTKESQTDNSFKKLMMLLLDVNFMILFSFVITFAIFPGVTISQPLLYIFFKFFSGMSESYRVNTLMLIFNVFDTVGRKFPDFLPLNKNKFYLVTFLRSIFLISFPMVVVLTKTFWVGTTVLSVITCLNMILCSFTNGYVASTGFSIAPQQVPDELKGKSGSSLSFFLIIGIFGGSLYGTFIMVNFV